MIDATHPLSVTRQAALVGISRAAVYYQAVAVSERDLALMRRIDELHLEQRFWGSRGLLRMLLRDQSLAPWINAGAPLGRKHVATLMRRMGIEAQCPKPGTSRKGRGPRHKVFPYLLGGIHFDQIEANTLWAMDTTYVFYPWADGKVTVSEGAADDLATFAGLPRESIKCIYNPVVGPPHSLSNGVSHDLPPREWWHGEHRRVMAAGTLKPIKDYGTLLSAFAALVENVDARLLILGEGDSRPMLEAQVRRLGLQGRVFMPGFAKNVQPYFERADLHVLSSTGEGLPTVIIEALSHGTPVVSTDCPSGPREILSNGEFGRLTPVGDPWAPAAAMSKSLAEPHDRVALVRRAQGFSIESAVDRYETLFFPDIKDGT